MPKVCSTYRVRKHRLYARPPFVSNEPDSPGDADDEDDIINVNENFQQEQDNDRNDDTASNENSARNENSFSNENLVEFENHISLDTDVRNEFQNLDNEIPDGSSNSEGDFIEGIGNLNENNPDEIPALKSWAVLNGIEQKSVDELLKILRNRLIPELPKTAKTFLGTSTANYQIQEMSDSDGTMGEYVYFGIRRGLEECLDPNIHIKSTVFLQVNVDGISLSNSGQKGFWVISGKVYYEPDIYTPFPIAIFCGNSKPASIDDFVNDFINEINYILPRGLQILNRRFNLRIHCFICDTPARAYLKGVKGHVGFFSCERCETQGLKENGVTQFPFLDEERTDESFRKKKQPGHHKTTSPLLLIRPRLNMISLFVLDFMHLFCEGVMKRLLQNWFILATRAKLGQYWKNEVSRRLLLIRKNIPCEFQRKIRPLKALNKWKATEFRFFLLYCGPIVMSDALSTDRLKNFILLHAATRILSCDKLFRTYQHLGKSYLQKFFLSLRHLYLRIQVLNMHHAMHAADDVLQMGCCFSRISAFPFENFLGKLTKLIRTPNRPLAQICRRLHELKKIDPLKPQMPLKIQILKSIGNDILKLTYKEYTLTPKSPDNFVMLKNNKFLRIKKIYRTQQGIKVDGNLWRAKRPLFAYPINSEILDMWVLSSRPSRSSVTFNLNYIEIKMVRLSLNFEEKAPKRHYCMPLLHH
ncbi:uncharacterized protein LOC122505698 [Leptopilina heterotoma]|uniref:uncharacterized protein LOC122505698 n=1 Tax=Leptopilina heterotoma TaxID=63436 RepID=UPI001CAA35A9|nr:uncharacterized protein LOC122505698 [Leptopilina heterotoma]